MFTVRRNVFETNSSSTHSITMCSGDEYDKWEKGELYYDKWQETLVTLDKVKESLLEYLLDNDCCNFNKASEITKEVLEEYAEERRSKLGLYTYEEFFDDYNLEKFATKYTTPKGEEVVAFGEYGYDC